MAAEFDASRQSLAGLRVWLTRPAHQAGAWAAAFEAAGVQVEREPLLTIAPPRDEDAAVQARRRAERADIVIATSPNAVHGAQRLWPAFAPAGTLCAVGAATARALQQATGRRVYSPARGDTSEDLLQMEALHSVAERRIVLLSGEGGRNKLMRTLTARGAIVGKVALYRRLPAEIAPQRLRALVRASDAAVVTSGEALQNLCRLLHAHTGRVRLQLVVPSRRVVKLTPDNLFEHTPQVATAMTAESVLAALAEWRGSQFPSGDASST